MAAAADANFRAQRIDLGTYSRALEEAYAALDLATNPEGLVNKAEALITYNASLRLHHPEAPTQSKDTLLPSRWQALTEALTSLTSASKLPPSSSSGDTNLSKIHLARGDAELLRFQLGREPTPYDVAAKNSGVLLKNAEKFYRGARALAVSEGAEREEQEASVKEALVLGLGGDVGGLREAIKVVGSARVVLEDAIDEGLVGVEQLVGMGVS